MSINFSSWTKATGDLLPGQQAVFYDFLTLVADEKVHLVHGANYRDGKPCLVNGTAQMLSHSSVSPMGAFPDVVSAFDIVCGAMAEAGLSGDAEGYVSPLMAEFLLRNFGELKKIDLTPAPTEAEVAANTPYVEASDDALMESWLNAMQAPAPEVVHEDEYARDFVNVRARNTDADS